jgi:hypothetical protein
MIPLGQWLAKQDVGQHQPSHNVDSHLQEVELPGLERIAEDSMLSDVSERLARCEDSLASALQELEKERDSATIREAQLHDQLGEKAITALRESIGSGLSDMQEAVESAIVDALTPFLKEAAVKKAAFDLTSSIRQVMNNSADPPIVVKVPKQLHPFLNSAMDQLTVQVTEADIDAIEVIFASQRARFEELSQKWVLTISGQLE